MEVIHFILGKANPERMNGVNKVVHELATRQKMRGLQVEVWGLSSSTAHDYPERCYTTRLFQKTRNPFKLPDDLKLAVRSADRSTVFHLHGGFVPAMYSAARLLTERGIRFVFTPHGSYNTIAMQTSGFRKRIYFRLFEKQLLDRAARIHALGKSEEESLQRIYQHSRSALIPYGFEVAAATLAPVRTGRFIVGFCGRLDVYTKGLKELVEGFAAFYRAAPGAQLWIIGDSRERAKLEALAVTLLPADAVVFWRARYGAEKLELLRQCSVFAAPSRNEGLPAAVLEAAALGMPCLVTEATNTGDAIRKYNAGIVMRSTDAGEVAEGLASLFRKAQTPSGYEDLRVGACRMIAEGYNWTHIVERFTRMYER